MKIFPYKRVRISKRNYIWVSKYPFKQPYDVQSLPDRKYGLTEFIPVGYPGCGFFARTTNSRTYLRRVQELKQPFALRYRSMLTSHLPSFSKLIEQGKSVVTETEDRMYSDLFETYVNMLILAEEEDRLVRIIAALRIRMRGRNRAHYSGDMKDCKRLLRSVDQRRKMVSFDVSRYYSSEVMESYAAMVDAFSTFSHIHHIWDMRLQHDSSERSRVFFDLGALDFVYRPYPIPIMRDIQGHSYYLLPDRVVRFRTPFELDTYMLRDIDIRYGALGDGAQSELMLSDLNLLFRFSSVRRVKQFVDAWKNLQQNVK